MTVEQIIEHLNGLKLHCEDIAKLKDVSPEWGKSIVALEESIKLWKKEIFLKPLGIKKDPLFGKIGSCPKCMTQITEFENRCGLCGQLIDWSDENDKW